MKEHIELLVNGDHYSLSVNPWRSLIEVLRDDLNLTGTKLGCGTGECGACTVLVDGAAVNSCLTLAVDMNGKSITTVEGLSLSGEKLHPIQEAFISEGAIQCGFCTSGMELTTAYLLNQNPNPTEKQIRAAISGNICRCTGYDKIVDAIKVAAEKIRSRNDDIGESSNHKRETK